MTGTIDLGADQQTCPAIFLLHRCDNSPPEYHAERVVLFDLNDSKWQLWRRKFNIYYQPFLLEVICLPRLLFRNAACWPQHDIKGNDDCKAVCTASQGWSVTADVLVLVADSRFDLDAEPVYERSKTDNFPVIRVPPEKYKAFLEGAESCESSGYWA